MRTLYQLIQLNLVSLQDPKNPFNYLVYFLPNWLAKLINNQPFFSFTRLSNTSSISHLNLLFLGISFSPLRFLVLFRFHVYSCMTQLPSFDTRIVFTQRHFSRAFTSVDFQYLSLSRLFLCRIQYMCFSRSFAQKPWYWIFQVVMMYVYSS